MDVINPTLPSIKIDALLKGSRELLPQLQQAGLFRAVVLESNSNRFILDTAFGQLIGKSQQPLNKGDEILARMTSSQSEPTIKVEQHFPRVLTLQNKTLSQLVQQGNQPLLEAKVVKNDNHRTQLQIGKTLYNLPPQKLLKTGETVLLKSVSAQQLELVRVKPQTILKNALSMLLPRTQPQTDKSGLASIQKVFKNLLKNDAAIIREFTTSTRSAAINTEAPTKAEIFAKGELKPVIQGTNLSQSATQDLKHLLQKITQTQVPIAQVKPLSIQSILTLLTFIKPLVNDSLQIQNQNVPKQLEMLQQLLQKSPEQFTQLLRDLISHLGGSVKSSTPERSLLELSGNLRKELLHQVEQTLNQILIQKTSIKLQLEQNLPLQFNLNIPIQMNDETTALKLKIKQKLRKDSLDEQHWEINLAFEFGLLGLISTHLLLQEKKLSAHFWAVEPVTKNLIDVHLDDFKDQLIRNGFEPGLFGSHLGQPKTDDKTDNAINDNLVDINV